MRILSGNTGRYCGWGRLGALSVILSVFLVIPLAAGDIPCEWFGIERVVAVGDLHGDYDHCVRILQGVGLIGEELNWTGGNTHLVQLGDIMDRGAEARRIFDLLMSLEKESLEAGGRIHVLIGNHEEANMIGTAMDIAGYMNWRQFRSFLPEGYRKRMERKLQKTLQKESTPVDEVDRVTREFWSRMMTSDRSARALYWENFQNGYGKWLLKKNLVIRINDLIFAHGGINEDFSTWKIKDINKRARLEINAMMRGRSIPRKIIYREEAPHWFRGLIKFDEMDFSDDVDRILQNLNARAIIVGHTVRSKDSVDDLSRFNGRVWGIDTGISGFYSGRLRALMIANDEFIVWSGDVQ